MDATHQCQRQLEEQVGLVSILRFLPFFEDAEVMYCTILNSNFQRQVIWVQTDVWSGVVAF